MVSERHVIIHVFLRNIYFKYTQFNVILFCVCNKPLHDYTDLADNYCS